MTTIQRLACCVGLGTLLAVAAACGSGDDDAGSNGGAVTGGACRYDPCSLITQAEAEAALGVKLTVKQHDTKASNATGQMICFYDYADDMKFVQLSMHDQACMTNGQTVESLYKSTKEMVTDAEPVPGVGDDAFFGGMGLKMAAGITTVVKSKGVKMNVLIGMGSGNSDKPAHIAKEKDLALKAIARL